LFEVISPNGKVLGLRLFELTEPEGSGGIEGEGNGEGVGGIDGEGRGGMLGEGTGEGNGNGSPTRLVRGESGLRLERRAETTGCAARGCGN